MVTTSFGKTLTTKKRRLQSPLKAIFFVFLPLLLLCPEILVASPNADLLPEKNTYSKSMALQIESSESLDDAWFFLVNTGVSRPVYSSSIQKKIDAEKEFRQGQSNTAGVFDLPGIYHRTPLPVLAGIVLNAELEHVAHNWRENSSYAIHTYTIAPSLLFFQNSDQRTGWMIRGDMGFTRILQIQQVDNTFHKDPSDAYSVLGALGYGWKAGNIGSLLLFTSYAHTQSPEHQINSLAFNMGFLL